MNSPPVEAAPRLRMKMPKKKIQKQGKRRLAPVAMTDPMPKVGMRQVAPIRGGDVRYRGIDYVGSLSSGTGALNSQVYSIDPNTTTFPRLGIIAPMFLKYTFHSVKFHLSGKSASTQEGNIGLASYVTDGMGGAIAGTTEALIKNFPNCLILKGWDSGTHEVPVKQSNLVWHSVDTDAGTDYIGSTYGGVFRSLPATTAAGDLSWDVHVEYDVELAGTAGSGAVN